MNRRKALALSYKLWLWLFKNPEGEKEDSPFWDEIKHLKNSCGLCTLYIENHCEDCPLSVPYDCFNEKSPYQKWAKVKDGKLSEWYIKPSAAKIVITIRKAIQREYYDFP